MRKEENGTETQAVSGEETEAKTVSEEKVRKIAIGATVGGVLLILFLLIVLIIQFVQMGVKNSARSELEDLIEEQNVQLENAEKDLDDLENGFGLFWKALDYNYKYQN